ncbi:MAG: hypothetical protein LBS08_00420 [Candidatus Symbiothrix sp.]|jgi:hypothetical protein|nr:hypothetical protein [Candidatus Symbiothrix sp.]
MKNNKILLTMALLLSAFGIAFTSCSDELEKADYDYNPEGALTLSTLKFDALEKVTDDAISLHATITDGGQSEIYDQGFIYSLTESFLTYSAVSVEMDTLANNEVVLVLDEYKIAQGKVHYFKAFVLTKDGLVVSADVKSINLPVMWEAAGVAEMTSGWAGTTGDVLIEHSLTVPNKYRLVSPYYILEPAYCPEPGYHLEFTLDENYNALGFTSLQEIGEPASNGNPIMMYGFAGNSFTNTANEFTVVAHFVYVNGSSYSGWANIKETFVWKEGYKGELPEPKLSNFNELAYEEIPGALSAFTSAAYYNSTWDQSLSKAVDLDVANEASQYKNLYYLADLYTDGYGLAFYYDGETVTIPENQPAGTTFKKPLYVSQSENIESSVVTTAKGVNIYTLGLNFHYEDGTSVGEFTEMFYYSKDPVAYAIGDFYGNYKLTGHSQWSNEPDADMDVTIAAGASENTFIITGIDFAAEVEATFDPATSTLSIAPQKLADYGPYDITLYTTTPEGSVSETAAMDFNFNISGNLIMTATSEADGYLLESEAAGGYVDGYYNLTFTPKASAKVASKASAKVASKAPVGSSDMPVVNKALQRVSIPKAEKCAKGNFVIQKKTNFKELKNAATFAPLK